MIPLWNLLPFAPGSKPSRNRGNLLGRDWPSERSTMLEYFTFIGTLSRIGLGCNLENYLTFTALTSSSSIKKKMMCCTKLTIMVRLQLTKTTDPCIVLLALLSGRSAANVCRGTTMHNHFKATVFKMFMKCSGFFWTIEGGLRVFQIQWRPLSPCNFQHTLGSVYTE